VSAGVAAPARVELWDGRPPHALGTRPEDSPWLDVYLPEPGSATGGAMLILPGGAYTFLSPKSGEQYGRWLAGNGIAGLVVNFRLGSDGYRYPAVVADACEALALVRRRACEWDVDPGRVGVIGTSAGGHLASLLLTGVAAEAGEDRPAVGVLCYSVISLHDPLGHEETRRNFLGDEADDLELRERFSGDRRVDDDTPPCFVWHTLTDEEVHPENSRRFVDALAEHGVPYELHLYEQGPHALGLAPGTDLHWPDDCIRWLRSHGL
jgi:acetyl esterase/lipase